MEFQPGDFVLLLNSYRAVEALQDKAHGGWKSQMGKVIVWQQSHSHNQCVWPKMTMKLYIMLNILVFLLNVIYTSKLRLYLKQRSFVFCLFFVSWTYWNNISFLLKGHFYFNNNANVQLQFINSNTLKHLVWVCGGVQILDIVGSVSFQYATLCQTWLLLDFRATKLRSGINIISINMVLSFNFSSE